MNIDWSKAPEGATHRDTKYGESGFWYKFDFQKDTAAYCPPDENRWTSSGKASQYNDGSMDTLVARPSEETIERSRPAILDDLVRLIDGAASADKTIAQAIYDAGYRKFEIVEEGV